MPKFHRALAFASILLSACGLDQTAPDPIDLQPSGAAPVLAPPVSLERARPLPLSSENVGWCDLVVHRRDGGPSWHSPLRAPASRGNAASGQPRPLGRIQFARWEKGTRRAVAEASCVVELDGRSARELRLAYALELDRALGQGLGNGQSSLRVFEGLEGSIWNGEDVDCMLVMLYTVVLEMDCGGVDCGPMATLRMAEEGPVTDIFFECDNGCTVDMDYLVYDCGNVGGDVDEGAGNGSGEGGEPAGDAVWEYHHVSLDGTEPCEGTPARNCVLEEVPDTLKDRLRTVINQMPEWARLVLLPMVNDTLIRRVSLWRDSTFAPTGQFIEGDTHGAIKAGYDPRNGSIYDGSDLHLQIHAFESPGRLKRVVCHEAVHLYWQIDEDDEDTHEFRDKVNACIENTGQ